MKRVVLILLVFGVGLAQAEPVTWYLVDANFAGGGSASGSFDYDADTNVYSSVAVTSTSGNTFVGAEYRYGMLSSNYLPSATNVNFSPASQPVANEGALVMAFASALTNAGGVVDIVVGSSLSKEGLCVEAPLLPEQRLSCDGGGNVNWLRTFKEGFVSSAPNTE
jgi:hypothetical protein